MLLCDEYLPRKRHREQSIITDDRPPKRTKHYGYCHPPQFWDSLSQITLTRSALKELDRRVAQRAEIVEVRRTRLLRSDTRLLRSDTCQLDRIAKDGGYDMSHLRGYAGRQPAYSNTGQSSSRNGKRTRDSGLASSIANTRTNTTGPYDPQFEQMLIDNGIFPDGHEDADGEIQEPDNIEAIHQRLAESRSSLSPSRFSEAVFKDFQRLNRAAKSESKAMSSVIPMITGARDRHYKTEENQRFNNLEKLTPGLKAAQPDKYYGASPSQIDARVRHDLSPYIIPSTNTTLPAAPNFFFEGKSAAGRPDVAQRQVMQDNAYGARGILHLQNYGKETPVFDGNAYTIGSSYHPGTGTLQMYATYPRQSTASSTEYFMTQLDAYAMTGSIDTFRRGAAAYRNSRDFTQEQRDQFIASANATARSASNNVPSSKTSSSTRTSFAMANFFVESDTSSDELLECRDVPGRDARPRKRASQTMTSSRYPQSIAVQASTSGTSHEQGNPSDNDGDISNNGYVTADSEQDELEDDEDEKEGN